VSLALTSGSPVRRRRYSPRRALGKLATVLLGVALTIWTIIPVYNILLIALSEDGDEFSGTIWPSDPSFESFTVIWTEGHWYLENFWHQFGNSIYIGLATMVLTVLVGSLASFAMGRMRLRKAWLLGDLSVIIYASHAHLWTCGQFVVGHRRRGHVRDAVRDSDLPSVWQAHSA
jgi:multiple sugar transport system permease protein